MTKHTKFIRSLPCVICSDQIHTQLAHIRFADPRLDKHTGLGNKPPDFLTVPLCNAHHMAQHETNEKDWWDWWRLDPHFIAMSLFCYSGNYMKCCRIIYRHQELSSKCSDLKKGIMANMLSNKVVI